MHADFRSFLFVKFSHIKMYRSSRVCPEVRGHSVMSELIVRTSLSHYCHCYTFESIVCFFTSTERRSKGNNSSLIFWSCIWTNDWYITSNMFRKKGSVLIMFQTTNPSDKLQNVLTVQNISAQRSPYFICRSKRMIKIFDGYF